MRDVVIGFALAALLLGIFFARSENYRFESGPEAHAYAADFLPDYLGAWILRHGARARLYDPTYHEPLQHDRAVLGFQWDESKVYPLLYPPFYYAALVPLTSFDYRRAAGLWAAVLVLCWAAAAWLAVHGLPEMRPAALWLLPGSVIFPPFAESLASGQKGTILLLLFASAFALWRSGHPLAAGVAFGLLAFKPHLAVVLGLLVLWKREWRFAVGALVSAGGLVALSFAMDPGLPGAWLGATLAPAAESARYFHFAERNQCWFGFVELLLGSERRAAVTATTALLDAGTLALLLGLWRGPVSPTSPRFAVQFSGVVLVTVLVSHHALTYDLTVLLIPLVLLLWLARVHPDELGGRRTPVLAAGAMLFLLTGLAPRFAERIPVQLGVVAMAGLLALLPLGTGARSLGGSAWRRAPRRGSSPGS